MLIPSFPGVGYYQESQITMVYRLEFSPLSDNILTAKKTGVGMAKCQPRHRICLSGLAGLYEASSDSMSPDSTPHLDGSIASLPLPHRNLNCLSEPKPSKIGYVKGLRRMTHVSKLEMPAAFFLQKRCRNALTWRHPAYCRWYLMVFQWTEVWH
jgi:hypothetical protein